MNEPLQGTITNNQGHWVIQFSVSTKFNHSAPSMKLPFIPALKFELVYALLGSYLSELVVPITMKTKDWIEPD